MSSYMLQRLGILLFDVGKMGLRSFKNFALNYKIEKNERSNSRDERTRTRIERTLVFVRVRPNMNEHEHGFFKNY